METSFEREFYSVSCVVNVTFLIYFCSLSKFLPSQQLTNVNHSQNLEQKVRHRTEN